MPSDTEFDAWSAGQSYEHYMGRWSRQIAALFVDWLAPSDGLDWLELGCGTGALTSTLLAKCAPRSILATDRSEIFIAHARSEVVDPRVRFEYADALSLPAADASVDAVASALMFNFVPDRPAALGEMRRVLRPGGLLSFYVWDYPGGGMGFIDAFWRAAATVDPKAEELNESARFPFCTPDGLRALCEDAGLRDVTIAPLEVETRFRDFEAFWHPFTLGAGPAPGYSDSLEPAQREALKTQLRKMLGSEGPIILTARAWAVKAVSD